ncbi:MAG: hypothetical protein ABIJ58_01430 [Nanoarchaeota archaeon]|nr:hypothetical protein [Nanoarchaeota archaeon]
MAQAKRKQKFFNVGIPLIAKETQLYGYDIEEFDGKTIIYDLTRLLRGKSMTLRLKVEVKNEKATTKPVELKVMPYFIRRMMRKGTNYVEDSFSTECKDATVRIKPFLITRKKVSRRVRKALREKCREELQDYAKNKSVELICDEIMQNKIQKYLSTILKKIYPLSMCEIKTFKVEKENVEAQKEPTKEEPKAKVSENPEEKEVKPKEKKTPVKKKAATKGKLTVKQIKQEVEG